MNKENRKSDIIENKEISEAKENALEKLVSLCYSSPFVPLEFQARWNTIAKILFTKDNVLLKREDNTTMFAHGNEVGLFSSLYGSDVEEAKRYFATGLAHDWAEDYVLGDLSYLKKEDIFFIIEKEAERTISIEHPGEVAFDVFLNTEPPYSISNKLFELVKEEYQRIILHDDFSGFLKNIYDLTMREFRENLSLEDISFQQDLLKEETGRTKRKRASERLREKRVPEMSFIDREEKNLSVRVMPDIRDYSFTRKKVIKNIMDEMIYYNESSDNWIKEVNKLSRLLIIESAVLMGLDKGAEIVLLSDKRHNYKQPKSTENASKRLLRVVDLLLPIYELYPALHGDVIYRRLSHQKNTRLGHYLNEDNPILRKYIR